MLLRTAQRAADRRVPGRREIDLSFGWRDRARFRVNGFRQRGSVAVALRLIPYDLPDLDSLGVPDCRPGVHALPQGLVLVTGTDRVREVDDTGGDGRPHQLDAALPHPHDRGPDRVRPPPQDGRGEPARGGHRHRQLRPRRCALHCARTRTCCWSGELRDLESIQTALTIAETGHLVLATLHTNDTAQALDRVVDVFPGDQQAQIRVQLASVLVGIVYQRLLPRQGGGRVAAHEVLVATNAVRNMIREGKTRQLRNMLTTGTREGMQTLEQSLTGLVASGAVAHEVAAGASLLPARGARVG